MGVLDKFLNAMKLNDDEDMDDDEFLDDEVDDFDEERPKKRLFKSRDEDEDDEDDDDEPKRRSKSSQVKTSSTQKTSRQTQQAAEIMPNTTSSKVSPIRPRKKSTSGESSQIIVLKPQSLDDAYRITEALWSNSTVILNLEEALPEEAQRIVDFSSGTCYALNGRIERISPNNGKMLIITPETVKLNGDFQERMGAAIDVHSRF